MLSIYILFMTSCCHLNIYSYFLSIFTKGIGSTAASLTPSSLLFRPLTETQMAAARLYCGGRHMLLLVNGDM
jgi:hypothetical protein